MKIPFFKPDIDETAISSVGRVLRSGWLTTGPKTLDFERKFAKYVGAKHAVFLNSGTAALHLALAAIGLEPGDEVITTPYTFAATTEVIEYFGARPIFVDIRPDTMNIDESRIEDKITPQTRAIIPVHFGGHPCEMDIIMSIARRHGLRVIEDAAHCTPAYFRRRPVGTIGHMTCLSFYANKCITTGEGGMLTTQNRKLADKVHILRLHGLSRDAIRRYSGQSSWKYDIVAKGFKYNPTDISAALGLRQLTMADRFFKRRSTLAALYTSLFSSSPYIRTPVELEHVKSSWHLYPIRLNGMLKSRRDEIITRLSSAGISTSVHFIPLHMHSYYRKKYGYRPGDYPIARDSYLREISLPLYPSLTDRQVKYISETLKKIIKGFV